MPGNNGSAEARNDGKPFPLPESIFRIRINLYEGLPHIVQALATASDIFSKKIDGGIDTGCEVMGLRKGIAVDQIGKQAVLLRIILVMSKGRRCLLERVVRNNCNAGRTVIPQGTADLCVGICQVVGNV